jgi:hypothetical protein
MELFAFLFVLVISNGVVGAIIAALLLRHRRALGLERVPLTIIGFGLAPSLITWCSTTPCGWLPGFPWRSS